MTNVVEYPACVQCGYCCTQGVCPFGEWGVDKCMSLTADNLCEQYEYIVEHGLGKLSPAFGAGCCCPLNEVRIAKIRNTKEGGTRK